MRDLNPRPTACKADALTAAPIAQPFTMKHFPSFWHGPKERCATETSPASIRFPPEHIFRFRANHHGFQTHSAAHNIQNNMRRVVSRASEFQNKSN